MQFVRKSYIYLLFYIFWEFLISSGKLMGSPTFKYIFFVITFSIFVFCFFKTKKIILTIDGQLWVPFFIWTILGSLLNAVPGIMFIWGTAFLVTLIAIGNNMKMLFPCKIIFYFGIIQILGQFIQMQYPTLYNQIMSFFFVANYKEWGSGYQGFTTQTGTTGAILTYALGAYLYFFSVSKNFLFNSVVVSITILSIFLTGKRSITFIAISIPLMVLFVVTKKRSILIKYGVPSVCAIFFLFYYVSTHIEVFEDIRGFKKISEGVEMFLGDEEMDLNGREELWEYAMKGYQENPMTGIGVAQFKEWSGLDTNPHNMYLQILCEQGIAGLTCFLIPLLFCLIHTILLLRNYQEDSSYRQQLKYSLYIQLFFIVYGLSGNPTRNAFGYVMYFCAIGIMMSFQYRRPIKSYKAQLLFQQ